MARVASSSGRAKVWFVMFMPLVSLLENEVVGSVSEKGYLK